MSREREQNIGDGTNNGYVETDPSGRYGRFNEVLGKGAMKTVYRAFDEQNGTEVAWNQAKTRDLMRTSDALRRMNSEVHLLSTLSHDSIITFHASWVDVEKGTYNFISELFTSGTLREYRLKYPRVNLKAIKSWARQILDGLVYLHCHDPPIIHRDIKCDNIFVNGHLGQVKIGDFGLSAELRDSESAHSVIGTPEFMAPDVYKEDYNVLVDIYSFGMCMLEMLISDYPYSECSNHTQIYSKVTSGKFPKGFKEIKDPEAKRFIGRCLETASKRSSAEELLDDPFLSLDDVVCVESPKSPIASSRKPIFGGKNNHYNIQIFEHGPESDLQAEKTKITITGNLNPENDTVDLKVQIANENGTPKYLYFPFDTTIDTPIVVAKEMVEELEITDWDPLEIADMIGQEMTILVPDWNKSNVDINNDYELTNNVDINNDYELEEYDEDVRGSNCKPFYCNSPTVSSSHGSHPFGAGPSSSPHGLFCHNWQDDLYTDDEEGSTNSGKYSSMTYNSCNESEPNPEPIPRSRKKEPVSPHKSTRFGENPRVDASSSNQLQKNCHFLLDNPSADRDIVRGRQMTVDNRGLLRNQSMVDIRSQLLHNRLVNELNERMFKTVGSIEDIGFEVSCPDILNSRRGGSSSSASRGERGKGKKNPS